MAVIRQAHPRATQALPAPKDRNVPKISGLMHSPALSIIANMGSTNAASI